VLLAQAVRDGGGVSGLGGAGVEEGLLEVLNDVVPEAGVPELAGGGCLGLAA